MLQKYFIAIVPPEPILTEIYALKKEISENYSTKGALRSPAHITLHMPFSWPQEKEPRLIERLESFKFHSSLALSLNGFSCFEPRVVFIRVMESEPLIRVQQQLVKHAKETLQLFNQADDMRGFHPHVTVAFRDLKKPVFYKLWEDYKDKRFEVDFTCQSFCLMKHQQTHWEVYKEFKL